MLPQNVGAAVSRGVLDFGRGFIGGAPPQAAMVAAPGPAAPGVPPQPVAARVPVTPVDAKSIAGYGTLSPAAAAVLANVSPQAAQAVAGAPKVNPEAALAGVPTFAQMMAGYAAGNGGKISLRAVDALAGAAQKGAMAGAAIRKQPSIADLAGAQAMQLGNQLFEAQKADAAKSGDKQGYLKATQNQVEMLKELSRAHSYDPLAAYGYGGGQQP